jgi:hypothetical protein
MRSLNYEDVKHIFHIVVKNDGRCACCVSDKEYPPQSGISVGFFFFYFIFIIIYINDNEHNCVI